MEEIKDILENAKDKLFRFQAGPDSSFSGEKAMNCVDEALFWVVKANRDAGEE